MNTATSEAGIVQHSVVSKDRWLAAHETLPAHEEKLTRLRGQIARAPLEAA